jgi:isoleucyl-tRNA synthetase
LTDLLQRRPSAFFFDIRKDSLYCDASSDVKRRSYRTVLDTLFHAGPWAAPVLVFTAEEVWGTRYPDPESVHLLEWPDRHRLARRCAGGNGPRCANCALQ